MACNINRWPKSVVLAHEKPVTALTIQLAVFVVTVEDPSPQARQNPAERKIGHRLGLRDLLDLMAVRLDADGTDARSFSVL